VGALLNRAGGAGEPVRCRRAPCAARARRAPGLVLGEQVFGKTRRCEWLIHRSCRLPGCLCSRTAPAKTSCPSTPRRVTALTSAQSSVTAMVGIINIVGLSTVVLQKCRTTGCHWSPHQAWKPRRDSTYSPDIQHAIRLIIHMRAVSCQGDSSRPPIHVQPTRPETVQGRLHAAIQSHANCPPLHVVLSIVYVLNVP
jgi:hypothetical protein